MKTTLAVICAVLLTSAILFAQGVASVAFVVSPDHEIVDSYSIEVSQLGQVVKTLNLGKPTPDAASKVATVNITEFYESLPFGELQAVVIATNAGGSARSIPSPFVKMVPLPPTPGAPGDVVIIPLPPAPPAPTPTVEDVVLYASDFEIFGGEWQTATVQGKMSAPFVLWNPNLSRAKKATPAANPTSSIVAKFQAKAGIAYHVWARMKAEKDSYANDSVYAQFSDSIDVNGKDIYRIGVADAMVLFLEEGDNAGLSGWGWNDNGYGELGIDIGFATEGTHTIMIQRREDGAQIDSIVLSPVKYRQARPGSTKDDATVIPR